MQRIRLSLFQGEFRAVQHNGFQGSGLFAQNLHCTAAAGLDRDGKRIFLGDGPRLKGHAVFIAGAVAIDQGIIRAVAQEIQGEFRIARVHGDAGAVPIFPIAAHHGGEVARIAVDQLGVVPDDRHILIERVRRAAAVVFNAAG